MRFATKVGDEETTKGMDAKPMRTLRKYGVVALDQSIAFKGGDRSLRWNMRILAKNPNALRAQFPLDKPKRET